MARRTVWLVTGIVTGAASSLYAERKLRRTLEVAQARLQPDELVVEVGRTARQAASSTGGRVREAVATARLEKRRREDELWSVFATAPDGRLFWQWDPATAKPDFLAPPEEEAAMVAAARRITCPTVLVRGSLSDLVPPENAARFKALMPHLVMVEAQGAGHMFTGDRNAAFGATLLEYLRKFAPV